VARATSSAERRRRLGGLVEDPLALVAGVGDAVLHVGQLGLGLGLGRGGVVELLGDALGAPAEAALDRRAAELDQQTEDDEEGDRAPDDLVEIAGQQEPIGLLHGQQQQMRHVILLSAGGYQISSVSRPD
jgi:hypothetical protein